MKVGPTVSNSKTVQLRDAVEEDIARIAEIYNQAVRDTVATFDTEEKSEQAMLDWFAHHDSRHPVVAAVLQEEVVGWGSLSEWSGRCAYAATCEVSIYVDSAQRGRGIGGLILDELLRRARSLEMHTVISRIAGGNSVSTRMHIDRGFVHIGTMREVGYKFGRLLDVDLYQIIFRDKEQ